MTYVHGTHTEEQARLSKLNDLLNAGSLRELALSGTERVLDVGSGLGQLARAMAATGARVLGIERSAEQLAAAVTDPRVELRQGDALALPLRDDEWGTFDVAHTRFLLEHVPDPLAVVRQMVRAVRPGGRVVLSDDDHDILRVYPEPPDLPAVWSAYQRSYTLAGNDPLIGRKLPELLHAAGATPRRCTWNFFGACHGDPDFPAFLDNLAFILESAIPAITATTLVSATAITHAATDVRALRDRPGAAIWYAMSWAEASVPRTST